MKHWPSLAMLLGLGACATGGINEGPSSALTERQTVQIGGTTYDVGQLTESTWTAIARAGSASTIEASPAQRAALVKEIERASKCRVTDSDYSQEGRQLDAQIDCARRLQN